MMSHSLHRGVELPGFGDAPVSMHFCGDNFILEAETDSFVTRAQWWETDKFSALCVRTIDHGHTSATHGGPPPSHKKPCDGLLGGSLATGARRSHHPQQLQYYELYRSSPSLPIDNAVRDFSPSNRRLNIKTSFETSFYSVGLDARNFVASLLQFSGDLQYYRQRFLCVLPDQFKAWSRTERRLQVTIGWPLDASQEVVVFLTKFFLNKDSWETKEVSMVKLQDYGPMTSLCVIHTGVKSGEVHNWDEEQRAIPPFDGNFNFHEKLGPLIPEPGLCWRGSRWGAFKLRTEPLSKSGCIRYEFPISQLGEWSTDVKDENFSPTGWYKCSKCGPANTTT